MICPHHIEKIKLVHAGSGNRFIGAISGLAVGVSSQPRVEFRVTHCVDI